jgi:hypothetical protein
MKNCKARLWVAGDDIKNGTHDVGASLEANDGPLRNTASAQFNGRYEVVTSLTRR